MREPPQIIYHLGVHKTASTLLQLNLHENKEELARQGVRCVNTAWPSGLERMRHRLRRIQNTGRLAPAEDAGQPLNERLVRQARSMGAHTILMSEENLIGNPIHRELDWHPEPARFYPRAAECLQALTYGLDPRRIRIILYTRRLDGLLRGHYSEALRALRTDDSFARFLDRTAIEEFRFDTLVARLKAALPQAKFIVRPYESIRLGPEAFVRDFLIACNIDPERIRVRTDRVNRALDATQADELRDIFRRLQADDKPRRLRKRARQINDTAGDAANPIPFPETHRARIDAAMWQDLSFPHPNDMRPRVLRVAGGR